jgi:hypothetical protein
LTNVDAPERIGRAVIRNAPQRAHLDRHVFRDHSKRRGQLGQLDFSEVLGPAEIAVRREDAPFDGPEESDFRSILAIGDARGRSGAAGDENFTGVEVSNFVAS